MTKCVLPSYNCTGWLGVKHQTTPLINYRQHLSSPHVHRLDKWHCQVTNIWSKWSFHRFHSQPIINNALERYITSRTMQVKSKVYDSKMGLGGWAILLALRRVADFLPASFSHFVCLSPKSALICHWQQLPQILFFVVTKVLSRQAYFYVFVSLLQENFCCNKNILSRQT